MDQYNPTGAIILGLLTVVMIAYGLYEKRQIEKLDRIIAEKEAALNAPEQPAATPR